MNEKLLQLCAQNRAWTGNKKSNKNMFVDGQVISAIITRIKCGALWRCACKLIQRETLVGMAI